MPQLLGDGLTVGVSWRRGVAWPQEGSIPLEMRLGVEFDRPPALGNDFPNLFFFFLGQRQIR
jgi:hypothetical protein